MYIPLLVATVFRVHSLSKGRASSLGYGRVRDLRVYVMTLEIWCRIYKTKLRVSLASTICLGGCLPTAHANTIIEGRSRKLMREREGGREGSGALPMALPTGCPNQD